MTYNRQLQRTVIRRDALLILTVLALLPRAAESFGVGCGIHVRGLSANRDQIFFAKHDDSTVLMQLGEELLTLAVVSAESKGQLRDLGEVMHRVYVAGSTRVEATFEVTRVCSPGVRECDGIGISATFVVRTGDAVQELRGEGGSGC